MRVIVRQRVLELEAIARKKEQMPVIETKAVPVDSKTTKLVRLHRDPEEVKETYKMERDRYEKFGKRTLEKSPF